jgi:hypothetical protein
MMIMTMIMIIVMIATTNIHPMHIPRFLQIIWRLLQTLPLFHPVSFAAGVPHKLFKALNFVTDAEQPLR